jgi:hypothetical protein
VKRRIAKLVIFLLAGAIVNVAVAWLLSAQPFAPKKHNRWLPNDDDAEWWQHNAPTGFAQTPAGVSEFISFGTQTLFMHEQRWSDGNRTLGNNCTRAMYGISRMALLRGSQCAHSL